MTPTYRPRHLPGAPRRRLITARRRWRITALGMSPRALNAAQAAADAVAPPGTPPWYEAATQLAVRR